MSIETMKRPSWTMRIFRVVLACLIVGAILSLMGVAILDIAVFALQLVRRIGDMGFAAFGAVLDLILLGAVLVIPIGGLWLLLGRR